MIKRGTLHSKDEYLRKVRVGETKKDSPSKGPGKGKDSKGKGKKGKAGSATKRAEAAPPN